MDAGRRHFGGRDFLAFSLPRSYGLSPCGFDYNDEVQRIRWFLEAESILRKRKLHIRIFSQAYCIGIYMDILRFGGFLRDQLTFLKVKYQGFKVFNWYRSFSLPSRNSVSHSTALAKTMHLLLLDPSANPAGIISNRLAKPSRI